MALNSLKRDVIRTVILNALYAMKFPLLLDFWVCFHTCYPVVKFIYSLLFLEEGCSHSFCLAVCGIGNFVYLLLLTFYPVHSRMAN